MGLVVEYHEELELDLADRGVDLLDLWRGCLSFRKLDLLVRDLARKPAESRLWTEVDPEAAHVASWKLSDYLAALQVDLIGKANFQNWKPIQRPDDEIKQRERRRRLIQRHEDRMRASG